MSNESLQLDRNMQSSFSESHPLKDIGTVISITWKTVETSDRTPTGHCYVKGCDQVEILNHPNCEWHETGNEITWYVLCDCECLAEQRVCW